jgi:hypothetical protein
MHEFRDLKPHQLLLDLKNPRLERIEEQELEALQSLWRRALKMLGMAHHITEKGLDPTARMAVISAGGSKFVALEGNRRLAALKALEDPGKVSDVLTAPQRAKLEGYSRDYLKSPVAGIPCAVFATREEADPWIELRHSPDPTGAGVLMWGAKERSRFKSRTGTPELALQIVDLVKAEGHLSGTETKATEKGRFITTLRRFVNDPDVRERLNITSDPGEALALSSSSRSKTLKALSKIVGDFATRRKTVKHVYHKPDRREYLDSLEASGALPAPAGPAPAPAPAPALGKKSGGGHVTGLPGPRDKLFAPTMRPNFTGAPRIAKIFAELRSLKVSDYRNAVAVLFRVFIELSVDHYLLKKGIMSASVLDNTRRLRKKVGEVVAYMEKNSILDRHQLKPVRRAMDRSKGIVGDAQLETIQAYVHNPHFHPVPEELKQAADDWQLFLETLWA